MNQNVDTIEYQGFDIEIYQDNDTMSPDDWGDNGIVFLVADHRDFYVKPPKDSTMESVVDDHKKTHHVFGLEAYIHSGVRLALAHEGNFPDRQWDVSQLGAVFVSKKEAKTKAQARKIAEGHIDTWNDYLSGNVYGYSVDGIGAGCGGYYGDYMTNGMIEDAKSEIDHHIKETIAKHTKTRKAQIVNHVPLEKRNPLTLN